MFILNHQVQLPPLTRLERPLHLLTTSVVACFTHLSRSLNPAFCLIISTFHPEHLYLYPHLTTLTIHALIFSYPSSHHVTLSTMFDTLQGFTKTINSMALAIIYNSLVPLLLCFAFYVCVSPHPLSDCISSFQHAVGSFFARFPKQTRLNRFVCPRNLC